MWIDSYLKASEQLWATLRAHLPLLPSFLESRTELLKVLSPDRLSELGCKPREGHSEFVVSSEQWEVFNYYCSFLCWWMLCLLNKEDFLPLLSKEIFFWTSWGRDHLSLLSRGTLWRFSPKFAVKQASLLYM